MPQATMRSPGALAERRAPHTATLARRLVEALGGRFSTELGIDVDRSDDDVERWALAATLFGNRITAQTAVRTYAVLARAGVHSLTDAGTRSWEELVALLDEGGYVRYDFRTATRLHELAGVLAERHGGRVSSFAGLSDPVQLERALDDLPGWGPVTVRIFLRELRGRWPGARPCLDRGVRLAAEHLGLAVPDAHDDQLRATLRRAASDAGIDARDLEAALLRLSRAHGRDFERCPGGAACPLA